MAPTNREILFVLKFRNLARQAILQFGASMKAGATGTNAAASAAANLQQNARNAAAAVNNVVRNTRAVNGGGFGGMARALRHANDQANGLSQTLMRLAGVAATAFAGGKVIEQADDYNTLSSRLRLVTDSQEQLNDTYEKLFQSAQSNRVAIGSTVELYARLANTAGELNLNQGQLLQITDSVSKALTVGGGNARANAATLLQLGQAFGAGALRGDELNSVLEQSASKLADNVASAWNTAINGVGDTLADMILKRKADFKSLVDEFAKQMLSAGIKNAMGNVIKGFTGQSPATIQAPTATVNAGTVTIAGVTGQIGGLATNSVASIANGAIPVGGAALAGTALTGLSLSRTNFNSELSNPAVLSQLYAMTRAEVGGQGADAQQAFMESIFNRASARGMSLEQTLSDKKYFPQSTFDAANRYASQANPVTYDELLNKVREGSNISGFATGNASGTVGFAGGPMTYASGGERFGIEGPDKAWARQMEEMTRVQQTGSDQQIAQAQQAQQQITQITQTGTQQQVQQAQQAQQQITSSYQQTAQQAQTLTPQFGQMGQNLSQFVGPLASVVPGLGQFSGALQQVLSFLLKGLGSIGGFGGGSIGLYHIGGVVGGPASAYRHVPAAAFAFAQRYHNGGFAGFKPNEVPAILKRRERVLTEAENKNYERLRARQADGVGALSSALQPVADRFNVALGGISVRVEGGSSGDRKKDADFANDIAEKVSLATEKQVLGILMNQQRPGGLLYKGRTNK